MNKTLPTGGTHALIESPRQYAAYLRSLTDAQLMVSLRLPQPFEPRYNRAAILLRECQRRGL